MNEPLEIAFADIQMVVIESGFLNKQKLLALRKCMAKMY